LLRSGNINQIGIVNGRLEDYDTLERAINENDIEAVFHLGAQPIVGIAQRSPLPTFEANIRGTYNLLEACRVHADLVKRVVVASSDKAYGAQEHLPYTEDMPLQGQFPYEVSKSCTDLLAKTYYSSYGLPVAIARCGNIFGGGDLNWSRIVPSTIRSFYHHESPIIRSDGQFVRDYIYVKDVVHAYLKLAESLGDSSIHGEAFNFSPERPLTVIEIVTAIQKIMKCADLEPRILNQASGEIHSQYLSSQKAAQLLGWESTYPLETALEETIQWYRSYFAASEKESE
jgi:CDP-glucose 4,6-dehydratase